MWGGCAGCSNQFLQQEGQAGVLQAGMGRVRHVFLGVFKPPLVWYVVPLLRKQWPTCPQCLSATTVAPAASVACCTGIEIRNPALLLTSGNRSEHGEGDLLEINMKLRLRALPPMDMQF